MLSEVETSQPNEKNRVPSVRGSFDRLRMTELNHFVRIIIRYANINIPRRVTVNYINK